MCVYRKRGRESGQGRIHLWVVTLNEALNHRDSHQLVLNMSMQGRGGNAPPLVFCSLMFPEADESHLHDKLCTDTVTSKYDSLVFLFPKVEDRPVLRQEPHLPGAGGRMEPFPLSDGQEA